MGLLTDDHENVAHLRFVVGSSRSHGDDLEEVEGIAFGDESKRLDLCRACGVVESSGSGVQTSIAGI